MNHAPNFLAGSMMIAGLVLAATGPASAANKEARVTQVIRDVKLAPAGAAARKAAVNDQVKEGIAVRTGDESRSELTFPDVTITRLGANTIFSFDRAGHSVDLSSGSVLLRVPKNSGGGNIRTNAVSVAITGTTVILETGRGGRSKLITLEGAARLSLAKNRGESREVRAGQMLDVPAGASTLPMPQNIDLNKLMKTHPLIVGFRPLPSRDLIMAAARNPADEPIFQGQPVSGGPAISIGPGFPGLPFPGVGFPGPRNPTRPQGPGRPSKPGRPSSSGTSQPPSNTGGTRTPGGTTTPVGTTTTGPKAPVNQPKAPPIKVQPRPKPTATPPIVR